MKSTKIFALLLVVVMCVSMLASCFGGNNNQGNQDNQGSGDNSNNNPDNNGGNETPKSYTYNTYVTLSPSNWNELTYQDNNDTEVLGWIQSSFFGFDFKYDANGEIIPGEYEVVYNAATALEDVSGSVDAKWGIPEGAKNRAWKITLRNDLKWENGDPIKAEDFVYTMSEQLNPLFQNYRADSYYVGSTILVNAQNYVKQGQSLTNLDNGVAGLYSLADLVKGENGVYTQPDGSAIYFSLTAALDWCSGYSVAQLTAMGYLDAASLASLQALADESGNVAITDESLAIWASLIDTDNWGHETPDYIPYYWVIPSYTYPAVDFADVGIYAASDYEIVIVLEKGLDLLKEDGTLSYKAAYNMASLPLVHKATYEAHKVAPDTANGETLWTSTYNSTLESTMSWGPYKLTSFQTGMQFVLERNDNWYGYGLEENEGLYQTTKIVYDVVKDWQSAWVLFQAGKLDGIGIDVSIAEDYKNSEQAFFTPSDFVGSLQLQSSKEALAAREEDGYNKTILSYTDFRKAISLSIDRADYTAKCTTSSKAGFGLFNSMHYYDVPNGGVFRNTDEAKKVLCEIYAIDYTDTAMYPTLDDAVAAISGYNLTEAAKLYTSAYEAALAAGDISATDKVKLTFGTGAVNDVIQRRFDYLAAALTKAVEGTPPFLR